MYSYVTCSTCIYIFICRVECYIKFGWDHLLIDPDKDLNSQRKLSNLASEKMELDSVKLLESLPNLMISVAPISKLADYSDNRY